MGYQYHLLDVIYPYYKFYRQPVKTGKLFAQLALTLSFERRFIQQHNWFA